MDIKVLYYGREAVLSGYYDSDCLKFNKKDGKPDFPDEAIKEYYDLPDEYVVYLWSLSIKDRMNIKYSDGNKCFCNRLGKCDSPQVMAKQGIVEIIGDDPLEYDALAGLENSNKTASVRCVSCGCEYRVNIQPGYRSSFYNWKQV